MKTTSLLLILLFLVACSKQPSHSKISIYTTPKIIAVYPTSDSLPENLLRFYIEFSTPMKAVNNLENIRLVDNKGQEIEGAIFNNVYELWDRDQKHLTLILDPARVKTGLVANQSMGRALKAHQHFQLIIETAEDIYGNTLAEKFVKDIYVQTEDQQIPEVKNWNINPPKARTKEPLSIHFPQILDRLSLLHRIRLINENGAIVKGHIELTNQEKQWHFIPQEAWKKGRYTIQINSRLEDPAGNNINGLFDHAIGGLKYKNEGKIIELDLSIN